MRPVLPGFFIPVKWYGAEQAAGFLRLLPAASGSGSRPERDGLRNRASDFDCGTFSFRRRRAVPAQGETAGHDGGSAFPGRGGLLQLAHGAAGRRNRSQPFPGRTGRIFVGEKRDRISGSGDPEYRRSSWDQLAVLYAAGELSDLMVPGPEGKLHFEAATGRHRWTPGDGKAVFLHPAASDEKLARLVQEWMDRACTSYSGITSKRF